MQTTRGEVKTRDRIRQKLESLPGVHRAVVNGPPFRILLVCDDATSAPPLEPAARGVLAELGVADEGVSIEMSHLTAPQPARRVRFLGVELARPHVGIAVATVRLEWNGTLYEGTSEGEGGSPLELRICGRATLRAIEQVLHGEASFDLIGVKAMRIFDHDLVSVLVHAPGSPPRRLIGVAVVSETEQRATALAVLNATNRILGNYLTTTD